MWKWMGLFLNKNHLLNLIEAIAKSASKKIGLLIRSMKLLCHSCLTFFYIFINLPYGHVWNTVVMSGLVLIVR